MEAVRIAFRTGLHVGAVAERLEGPPDACESWSTIVATADKTAAEDAIDSFNQSYVSLPLSIVRPSQLTLARPSDSQVRYGSVRIRQAL